MNHQNINIYPINLHFTTHTNPMWNDITDDNDHILLSKVFRLDNFREAIDYVLEKINKTSPNIDLTKANSNPWRGSFSPSNSQIKKIQKIYKKDFDLYESINF